MTNQITDFYLHNTGKLNFGGDETNPGTVYLQGISGSSPGICVGGNFVMHDNYINFGISSGESGYGIGSSGGSIVVKNNGGNWTVITDGTPQGPLNSVQFNDNQALNGSDGFLYAPGSCTVSVNGNIFSNFGVSGDGGLSVPFDSQNVQEITAEEFVNGIFFPKVVTQKQVGSDHYNIYRIKVPGWSASEGISIKFPELANSGFRNSFETTFYGTCQHASGSHTNPVITIMNSDDKTTRFDSRLTHEKGSSLSFSLSSDAFFTGGQINYYPSVTIKSIVHSSGISMYPVAAVDYRVVEFPPFP